MSMSAVEVYFDDCYDLLNNKIKVAVAGFGRGVKAKPQVFVGGMKQNDASGKWVDPVKNGTMKKDGTIIDVKEEFEAKG